MKIDIESMLPTDDGTKELLKNKLYQKELIAQKSRFNTNLCPRGRDNERYHCPDPRWGINAFC